MRLEIWPVRIFQKPRPRPRLFFALAKKSELPVLRLAKLREKSKFLFDEKRVPHRV